MALGESLSRDHCAPGLLVIQFFIWLKTGSFPTWPAGEVLGRFISLPPESPTCLWWKNPTDWVRLHRFITTVGETPIVLISPALGLLMLAVLWLVAEMCSASQRYD